MVATDINLKALSIARGLESLVQQQRIKQGKTPFIPSDFVVHDAFNKEEPLHISETLRKLQSIGLVFRLSIVAPNLTISNVTGIEDFTRSLIKNNDVCVMHFLQNSTETFTTLKKHYRYSDPVERKLQGVSVLYSKGNINNFGLYTWNKEKLEEFISASGGSTLFLDSTEGVDDLGGKIKVLTSIVEKKKKS
jgi:hypothetical protein